MNTTYPGVARHKHMHDQMKIFIWNSTHSTHVIQTRVSRSAAQHTQNTKWQFTNSDNFISPWFSPNDKTLQSQSSNTDGVRELKWMRKKLSSRLRLHAFWFAQPDVDAGNMTSVKLCRASISGNNNEMNGKKEFGKIRMPQTRHERKKKINKLLLFHWKSFSRRSL